MDTKYKYETSEKVIDYSPKIATKRIDLPRNELRHPHNMLPSPILPQKTGEN